MASVYHNRLKHTSYADLSEKYQELSSCLDDYCKNAASRIFLLIEKGLSSKLLSLADENSVFSSCVNKTFSYYRQLMDSYLNIIGTVGSLQASIITEPVRDIFSGIIAILESRLNYFNELSANGDDPIISEKNEIIEAAQNAFLENINKLFTERVQAVLNGNTQNSLRILYKGFNYNSALEFLNYLYSRIEEELYTDIHIIFNKTYADCVRRLDSMDIRRQVNFYFELLKNEYNELSIIVTKQISEIEAKASLMDAGGEEHKAVFNILTLLRETYQHTGKLINDMDECFECAVMRHFEGYSFDELKEYLYSFAYGDKALSVVWCDEESTVFNPKLNAFKAEYEIALKKCTAPALAETSLGHVIYHIKKYVTDNTMMAESLIEAFSYILEYFNENGEVLSTCENFEIIQGIYDTVKIKTDCLEENKEILGETAQSLIDSNKELIPSLSGTELEELMETGIVNWFESGSDTPDFDALLHNESFTLFLDKRKKQHDALLESLNKKSMEYKKDFLLFEISTYEEIMNYSVSRLKETENPVTLAFVAICDDAFYALTTALKRNNIAAIRPEPHDMFNAKEHEVLMAEKNEEFQKGEIIKLMNSGYKQDDFIIMRANVIAAK